MQNYETLLNSNPRAELAKRNLIDFVSYIKKDYKANWHHELLASHLDKFVKGEIKKLMVFMPPQHGKSELVSRMLPAFILGKKPKSKIVLASYSSTLASSFNRECQRYIDSIPYHEVFPETYLSQSNVVTVAGSWLRNSEIFETIGFGGFLKTVGVGGSLTGTPADYAIIDDPVKDSLEASSPTYQTRNWDWFNDVLMTRLHNDSSILITQTRWDENDLSGLILKKQAELNGSDWCIINLPAIKENNDNPDDPRKIGEALWPQKHSKERLMQVQKQSIRTFQSLYQQNPQPTQAGGEFYKEFRVEKHVKKIEYDPSIALHISWDENVNPYLPCGIFQIKGKSIVMIDEITGKSPNNTYKWVCKEIIRKYQGHASGMFIYGDATSQKEDVKLEKGYDFFRLIIEGLHQFKPQQRVAKSNPSVIMRGNFINTVLESEYDGVNISIGENCSETIKDFLYVKEEADGTKFKQKIKDLNTGRTFEKHGHFSDLTDYIICYAFASSYAKYQQGGRVAQFKSGNNYSSNNW